METNTVLVLEIYISKKYVYKKTRVHKMATLFWTVFLVTCSSLFKTSCEIIIVFIF